MWKEWGEGRECELGIVCIMKKVFFKKNKIKKEISLSDLISMERSTLNVSRTIYWARPRAERKGKRES